MKIHTRTRIMTGLFALGSLVIGAAATAEENSAKSRASSEVAMMDTDHDGKVSAAEYSAFEQKLFGNNDTNKDGKITVAELEASYAARKGEQTASAATTAAADASVKRLDTDGDGTLTAAEHAAGFKQMFVKMDANADGAVTAEEMQASQAPKKVKSE